MTRLFAPADPALLAHTAVPLVPPADVRQWERDGVGMLEIALAGAGLVRAFRKGVATDSQARKLVEQLIVDGRAKLGAFTEAMAAGRESLGSWVRNVFADVSARSTAAVMGFRKEPTLRPADVPPLVARVARQGNFLAGFAKDIKDKVVRSAKQAVARVKLYADAVWGTGYGVLLDRAIADGYTEAQRVLGVADHCFPAGTMVETKDGALPIESIRLGQMVLTRFGYRPVTCLHRNEYRGDMVRIKASGRVVVATANHPFLTGRGWVRAAALVAGDDTVFLKDAADVAGVGVGVPDPNHGVAASSQVSVPGGVLGLLLDLPFVEGGESRVSVPPAPVGLDDEPADAEVDDEVRLEQDLALVNHPERVKDASHLDFELARPVLLELGVGLKQGANVFGVAEDFVATLDHSFPGVGQVRRVVGGHVSRGLGVDDLLGRFGRQREFLVAHRRQDPVVTDSQLLGDPGGPLGGVMLAEERLLVRRPDNLPGGFGPAHAAQVAVPVLSGLALGADVAARFDDGSAPQAEGYAPEPHVPALGAGQFSGGSGRSGPSFAGHVCESVEVLRPGNDPPHLDCTKDVYNLTVESHPEYFANGFLVHNCKQCLMLSFEGWLPIRQVTPIGQTVCQARCHCHLNLR